MRNKLFTLLFAIVASTVLVNATTVTVNPGSNSLQSAVASATAGDVLELSNGTFTEHGDFAINKNLTIKAADGAKPVISNLYYFKIESGAKVTFQGIEFDGSGASDHCIRSHNGSTGTEELVLDNCAFHNYPGYVIYTHRNTRKMHSITIRNCIFKDNPKYSVAVMYEGSTAPSCDEVMVENSTFLNTTDKYAAIYIMAGNNTKLNVDHCTFHNFDSAFVKVDATATNVAISNCIFAQPTYRDAAPVVCSAGTINNCLAYNCADYAEGPTVTACSVANPLFADATHGDFTLGAGSPALNAGTESSNLGDPFWWPGEEPQPIEPNQETIKVDGTLSGLFSVGEDKKVCFSKGNLQYQASTNTWRFAKNQYDYVGDDSHGNVLEGAVKSNNLNISVSYDGWIDLFGWGTSGYDNTANDPFAVNYQPWAISTDLLKEVCTIDGDTYKSIRYNPVGYGPSTFMPDANLTGTSANYDWGVYNAISNGGNEAGKWRTLTFDEWYYIFNTRSLAQNLRSRATVCGVHGYVLLPDNFTLPDGLSWNSQTNNYWDTNTYDSLAWSAMEAIGAVFLPAAGGRQGTNADSFGESACYWSASYDSDNDMSARSLVITPNEVKLDIFWIGSRYRGYSVRLVQDYVTTIIPTDINDCSVNHRSATKRVVNGQILILRGDKTYTLQGQEVR